MKAFQLRIKYLLAAIASLALVSSAVVATPANAAAADRTVIIHYYRTTLTPSSTATNGYCDFDPCGIYDGWNMWLWMTGTDGVDGDTTVDKAGLFFDAEPDSYGAVSTFHVTKATSKQVGFLFRIGSNWSNAKADVPDDRFITLKDSGTTEVWFKENDPTIYYANPNDRVLRVHYHRADNNYAGWDIFSSDTIGLPDGAKSFSTKNDCFGRVAEVRVPEISQTVQPLVFRKSLTGGGYTESVPLLADLPSSQIMHVWVNDNELLGEDVVTDGKFDLTLSADNPNGHLMIVHYNRPEGDYNGWKVWSDGTPDVNLGTTDAQNDFKFQDAFGSVACGLIPNPKPATVKININKDWLKIDTTPVESLGAGAGDRVVTLTGAITEIWMQQGKATVYTVAPVLDPIVKKGQSISKVPATLKNKKSLVLPAKTNLKLVVKWTSITPGICKIAKGKLTGVSKGKCKLSAVNLGNIRAKVFTAQIKVMIN